MRSKTPTDQQILDAKIAPAAERWSPGRENPAIGMDEGILRTLAKHDEGARRAVQLAAAWNGPEVPGNKLDALSRPDQHGCFPVIVNVRALRIKGAAKRYFLTQQGPKKQQGSKPQN